MSAALLPVHYTLPEFLAWEPGDGRRYELADGQPRAMAPSSAVHGLLQAELTRLVGDHLRRHRPACRVIANPGVVPPLLGAHNFRIPDLGVTCAPLSLTDIAVPSPLLLAEVLSPGNQADTWSNVWTYTSIPSAEEILVLHSARVMAELLRRGSDGNWPAEPVTVRDGALTLASIGFSVDMTALYEGSGLLSLPGARPS